MVDNFVALFFMPHTMSDECALLLARKSVAGHCNALRLNHVYKSHEARGCLCNAVATVDHASDFLFSFPSSLKFSESANCGHSARCHMPFI